ncbi:MAG: hypothetical protein GY769_18580 [bacterium]|nr:hypothetical protein [bacterium]
MARLPTSNALGILGNSKLGALYEKVEALDRNVGTQAFELEISGFEKAGSVSVFDEVVDVTGNVSLEPVLKIHASSQKLSDLFGSGAEFKAPTGSSFADFGLTIGANVGAEGTASTGALKISAKGSVETGIDYRHLLPVKTNTKRLTAFNNLLKTTRPPQLVDLSKNVNKGGLADGEIHRLDATLNLDFGLDAEFGHSFALDTSIELFDGLPSAKVTASGEMAIKAALGLSLHERMLLAIGRSDRWARVRLQRERERRIGFSAMMALQAEYDFGGGLATVLEQALGQSPIPRLIDSLREVDAVAAGDWETIKTSLTGDVADAVGEFVNDTHWKEWLAGSNKVKGLLEASREIVEFYDKEVEPFGAKLESFWDQLLGKADLSPGSKIRTALSRLTGLDDPDLEIGDLVDLSSEAAEAVDLIETLSGKSLEELLLSSDSGIRKTLADVAGLAKKAEELFDLDNKVIEKIRAFTERTGIAGTIDKLRQVQTKEELEAAISARLRKLIERLAGEAWDKISAADLKKIQSWAQKIKNLLDDAEGLQAEILQKIREIRGEIGFSLGLEISRVSTSTALIDVDIDLETEKKFRNKVEQRLKGAEVRKLLDTLAERVNEEKAGALPFRLRECAFTSRRVRTSSMSFVFKFLGPLGKLLGNQKGVSRRVEEANLRVRQDGKKLFRSATYNGGFQRTEIWNKTTSESALWLEIEAADTTKSMPSLEAPFEKETSRTLRATYSREDNETTASELAALKPRLESLGFVGGSGLADVPALAQTRLAFDIRLPGAALSEFCAGVASESSWNRSYLGASRSWFHDQLVDKRFKDLNLGDVLATVVKTNKFLDNWTKDINAFGKALKGEWDIPVAGQQVEIQPILSAAGTNQPRFAPNFDPILQVYRRRKGFKAVGKLRLALGTGPTPTPAAYREATRASANGWRKATACSVEWPTPTFGMWLLMTRLAESDTRQLLRQATGVATLRWKQSDDWKGPVTWRLEEGKGVTPPGTLVIG